MFVRTLPAAWRRPQLSLDSLRQWLLLVSYCEGEEQLGDFSFGNIMDLARDSRGKDPFGYRGEFLSLVRLAESLSTPNNAGVQQLGLIE